MSKFDGTAPDFPPEPMSDQQIEGIVNYELIKSAAFKDEAHVLLREWLTWWIEDDTLPAKLPNGLHVRTVVHLLTDGGILEPPPGGSHAP